jgi:signal transduction histidine kinase
MEPTWWQSAFHLVRVPRTVRLRLTLLYGAVVLVFAGALLVITFAVGSNASDQAGGIFVRCSGTGSTPLKCAAIASSSTPLPPSSLNGPTRIVLPAPPDALSAGGSDQVSGVVTIGQAERGAEIARSGTVHDLLLWSLLGLGIVTVLALLLGWWMSGRMLRPLRTITTTTQHISEENLHERLELPGPRGDELKELGDTIDGLLARLETAFETQGRFVQNASHELRTPITMMRTSLDVATGKPGGVPPEVTVLADKLGEGLDQAERLLESFLVLARIQSEQAPDRRAIDLSQVVARTLEVCGQEIDDLELAVERELEAAVASGSETLLARIVANLIDNAVRHNEPGGWLRVTTETEAGRVRLVVENGGLQLDPGRVAQLGQPFQRLVADRTASDRSIGLGLSIVAAITQAEGGTLTIHGRDSGGLRVTIELSAARALVGTARP